MERLTFEGNFCDIAMCVASTCPVPETGCSQRQVWERLKAYEDLGLSPEDIKSHLESLDELVTIGFTRLMELVEADKDNRCMILPCKIDDTAYKIYDCCSYPTDCVDPYGKQSCKNCDYRYLHIGKEKCSTAAWPDGVLGKDVFLTREAAEAALKNMEE